MRAAGATGARRTRARRRASRRSRARTASRRRRAWPCSSANAGMPISSTPSATAVSASASTSTRNPGVASAPAAARAGLVRLRPPAPRVGRGGDAEPARGLERDAGEERDLGRDRRRDPRGQQRAGDEHELEQERVERERGVEPLAADEPRQQRRAARGRPAGRRARPRTRARSRSVAPPPSSTATTNARPLTAVNTAAVTSTFVCPTRSITPAQHRCRDADAQPGRRGDDPDLRVVEAGRPQQQDHREDVHPVRQPRRRTRRSISGVTPGMRSRSR